MTLRFRNNKQLFTYVFFCKLALSSHAIQNYRAFEKICKSIFSFLLIYQVISLGQKCLKLSCYTI